MLGWWCKWWFECKGWCIYIARGGTVLVEGGGVVDCMGGVGKMKL